MIQNTENKKEECQRGKISVIVPVYNTELYVGRCIESLLNSTYKNLEIICVDDGSTDHSLTILQEYEKKNCRVKVYTQKNGGVSSARNKGLKEAEGEFIGFVDSDDWVHPQMFEILSDMMDNDVIVSACRVKQVKEYREEVLPSKPACTVYPSLLEAYKISTIYTLVTAHLYRASILKNKFFKEGCSLGEDGLFNLCLASINGKCAFMDLSVYYYFQNNTSAMHSSDKDKFSNMLERYIDTAEKEKDKIVKQAIYEKTIRSAFMYRYLYMFDSDHKEYSRFIRKLCKRILKNLHQLGCSPKLMLIYSIMTDFPILYRMYITHQEPGYLRWEKEQRNVLKQQKLPDVKD